MRYRKLKVKNNCKLRKMTRPTRQTRLTRLTRLTRQIFPPDRIRKVWCENCYTCKIANLQLRWVSEWQSSVQEMPAHLKMENLRMPNFWHPLFRELLNLNVVCVQLFTSLSRSAASLWTRWKLFRACKPVNIKLDLDILKHDPITTFHSQFLPS